LIINKYHVHLLLTVTRPRLPNNYKGFRDKLAEPFKEINMQGIDQ